MANKALTQGQYHHTLDEVAKEIGVTRERVRQIEAEALQKLKLAFEEIGITATVLDEEPEHQGPGLFDANARTPVLKYRT